MAIHHRSCVKYIYFYIYRSYQRVCDHMNFFYAVHRRCVCSAVAREGKGRPSDSADVIIEKMWTMTLLFPQTDILDHLEVA